MTFDWNSSALKSQLSSTSTLLHTTCTVIWLQDLATDKGWLEESFNTCNLCQVLGVKWHNFIQNKETYRCISQTKLGPTVSSHWQQIRLLGPVALLPKDAKATAAIHLSGYRPSNSWKCMHGRPSLTWLNQLSCDCRLTQLRHMKLCKIENGGRSSQQPQPSLRTDHNDDNDEL